MSLPFCPRRGCGSLPRSAERNSLLRFSEKLSARWGEPPARFKYPAQPVQKKVPPGKGRTRLRSSRTPAIRYQEGATALLFEAKVKTPFRTEQGFVLRFICVQELALRDSAYRAGTCAGTAIYTCVSVDLVLAVALSDSANRALASARAAHNAAATDNICHWYCTSKCILQLSFYHKI